MSSREKILTVSLEQFYRNGYLATSVDDIIADAKVSKSNFYYHFKSKEDLGIEVLQLRARDLQLHLDRLLACTSGNPRERLHRLVDDLAEAQDKRLGRCGCPFGNLVAEMAERSERFRCALSGMFAEMTNRVSDVVRDGQAQGQFRRDFEPDDAAALFIQTVQGMLLLTKCNKSVETLGRGARLLIYLMEPR